MTIKQVLDFLVDVEMTPKVVLTTKTGNKIFDKELLSIVTSLLTDDYFTKTEFKECLNVMSRNAFKINWK
jgi:hypothetical protein